MATPPETRLSSLSTTCPPHVTLLNRLEHFTWSWFEITMSTGALSSLLSQQPYTFPGLLTIGKLFFILTFTLFLLFTTLITLRFILTPSSLSQSLHHPIKSFYFGTFWVSIAFIIYSTSAYGSPSTGPWLTKTLEIFFWLYMTCALFVAIFQYHTIFAVNKLLIQEMMPAWILPVYPFLIIGPLAGQLLYHQPSNAALPILLAGLMCQGFGWTFAFIQYTLYITRLTTGLLPPESKRPGMYVAVGPASYTSTALVLLGSQAKDVLPEGFLDLTIPVGEIWKAMGVVAGMFLWLVGFWFSAISTVAFVHGWKRANFSMSWWATVFPNAGLMIALIQIGKALDCGRIKAVGSGMTVMVVVAWCLVTVFTVKAVRKGEVLWPGRDEDMEDIEEAKE